MAVSIKDFLELVSSQGGVAMSNRYKVTFEGMGSVLKNNLQSANIFENQLSGDRVSSNPDSAVISLMCDEANLPGVQAASGQINGLYTGSGTYNYPHTKLYTDLTLSWICDAQMTPLKFLQIWLDSIFVEEDTRNKIYRTPYVIDPFQSQEQQREHNRSTRLNYRQDYQSKLSIVKAEMGREGSGPGTGELGRPSIRYRFDGVWPYSIDTIPLSFGSSQLVKVSANFYYERWYTYHVRKTPSFYGAPTPR
jgi:hypothetical protein